MAIINNIYFQLAEAMTKGKKSSTITEIAYVIAQAGMATAYEMRTQNLLQLCALLGPGTDYDAAMKEIMERLYG